MNEEMIKSEFKKQAKEFSNKQLTMNNMSYLQWMLREFKLSKEMEVLDVAAGTGILSRAIAPSVKSVISMDISEDMIREGKHQNELLNVNNIEYRRGNVEKLPFENESFDLVVSRFAFHHFEHPKVVLQEMSRVSRQTVCVIDMISSEEDEAYQLYNFHERMRDPSHTNALKESEFKQLFNHLGLVITHSELLEVDVSLQLWLELTQTKQETADTILSHIRNELETGALVTGMDPFYKEDKLFFKQRWIKIIGEK